MHRIPVYDLLEGQVWLLLPSAQPNAESPIVQNEGAPMIEFIKHLVISSFDQRLPFYIESIGCKKQQNSYFRQEGYPYYHWLQTYKGQGEFHFAGKRYVLQPGDGVLLAPGVPHRYEAITSGWSTLFLTFGGSMLQSVFSSLQLQDSSFYRLANPALFVEKIETMIDKLKIQSDATGLDLSADLYSYMVLLKKYGLPDNRDSSYAFSLESLNKLLQWMDTVYSNPQIELSDMADQLHISKQHLMSIFRRRFGISPYAYFIRLRINKSKEFFAMNPELTVKEVAGKVGFHDVSHFVATFRRLENTTPDSFKKMYIRADESGWY